MKQKPRSFLRSRRGVSIAEAVVAIAIIMIVSAAAVSLLFTATGVGADALHDMEINEYAESALECFRWADTVGDFEAAVTKLGFDRIAAGEYVLEQYGCRIEIRADYSGSPYQLNITAKDKDGDEMYRFAYEKNELETTE